MCWINGLYSSVTAVIWHTTWYFRLPTAMHSVDEVFADRYIPQNRTHTYRNCASNAFQTEFLIQNPKDALICRAWWLAWIMELLWHSVQSCKIMLVSAMRCDAAQRLYLQLWQVETLIQSTVPMISTPVLCQTQCMCSERHSIRHMRGHHESHQAFIQ